MNLHPAIPISQERQKNKLEILSQLNRERQKFYPGNSDLEARIQNYELAARMQKSAEEAMDISRETATTRKLYGLEDPEMENYGTRCLMARRMVEAGVRFVQVTTPRKYGSSPWDHHHSLHPRIKKLSYQVDQPTAALIKDLKSRGLLESTILLWTGEFGRLPISQNGTGRDHNQHAFSLLLAGGGFKSGFIHGATDDFGYKGVEGRTSVHDLHATLLYQLGIDHHKLSYNHNGRDERLTDPDVTGAKVVTDWIA